MQVQLGVLLCMIIHDSIDIYDSSMFKHLYPRDFYDRGWFSMNCWLLGVTEESFSHYIISLHRNFPLITRPESSDWISVDFVLIYFNNQWIINIDNLRLNISKDRVI